MSKQKTLKESFSLSSIGLHTGLKLTVTFNPAPEGHGGARMRRAGAGIRAKA
jgi:UDP-3-O-[3-hydroxymyristoyl] N-acetylglucosamine deacetylase/3-hydroxyacyl-[acyl-carrier-protein] dehydratase